MKDKKEKKWEWEHGRWEIKVRKTNDEGWRIIRRRRRGAGESESAMGGASSD